jgi:hypothetical protein
MYGMRKILLPPYALLGMLSLAKDAWFYIHPITNANSSATQWSYLCIAKKQFKIFSMKGGKHNLHSLIVLLASCLTA